jgi:cyclin H
MTSAKASAGGGAATAGVSASGEEQALNSKWHLSSETQLDECRTRANGEGVKYLQKLVAFQTSVCADAAKGGAKNEQTENKPEPLVKWFASGYAQRCLNGDNEVEEDHEDQNASTVSDLPNPPLTPGEELLLLQFYSGKIPDLIGPAAVLSRLRRDVKVTATASALFRRFYLSNSVMTHDPKAMMVASAFLASKVEDATVDIRYLEEATKKMEAPVTQTEIIDAEIALVSGVHFELLCFHPYKTVLAYTEDLRTYLKTDQGKVLATFPPGNEGRPIVGEDLRPMHDEARSVVDDACVSDVILLASPGQIGLAAIVVANEDLQAEQDRREKAKTGGAGGKEESQSPIVPNIDLLGYLDSRFADQGDKKDRQDLRSRISKTCDMLRALREGKYGCGNHGIDMVKLKEVHKKWKTCRSGTEKSKKKKKKKRKAEEGGDGESEAKRAKAS